VQKLVWRLVYLDREITEPITGRDIADAPRGARQLLVLNPVTSSDVRWRYYLVARVELGKSWLPFFYHRERLAISDRDRRIHRFHTWFGCVRPGYAADGSIPFEGTFCAAGSGRVEPSTPDLVDFAAIARQVLRQEAVDVR